ncbi:tryptophan-rich sensory protein TspO [Tropicimonas sp. S265A]|uniref:tryptophan-rich sensory protein TspO n=1 Tax=Tropicimonas sp. S265A TaxID=3415134 RepID=UPI003C7B5D42
MEFDWAVFTIFLGACSAAAATGSMFPPGRWYDALQKPSWNPPKWVFPVVWSVLYLAIAVSAARVADAPGSAMAMAFWAFQIALNTLWTPVFFGLRRIKAGMVVIGLLWVSVLGTVVFTFQVEPFSGLLLLPYLAWVTIAAALNAAVWRLNPEEANTPREIEA